MCPLVPDYPGTRSTGRHLYRSGSRTRHFFPHGVILSRDSRISVASSTPLIAVEFLPDSTARQNMISTLNRLLKTPSGALELLPPAILVILYHCSINAMRISELLNLTTETYCGNGIFHVRGCKSGRDYIIHLPISEYESDLRKIQRAAQPLFDIDYRTVWRWCKLCGIGKVLHGRKTYARTHLSRYYISQAVTDADEDNAVSEILHHRSYRNSKHYLQKREVKHG